MQIVKRGTKGKSFFLGGTKKTTSQVDIFNIIQKRPTTVLFLQIKVSVEPFVVGFGICSCEFSDRSSEKIKMTAELTILKARCENLQFTCAILIVSSRQNCRGHIMHHHDTFHKMLPPPRLARV